ncbi:MAG: hypothetical protein ABSA66_15650 [Roseiarcus sp.]|jgi:hypothetical protein
MRDVPLAAVLGAVAERFALPQARVRLGADDAAREARRVYCYLARGLTQADAAEIGALIIEDAAEVEAAIEGVAARLSEAREFAELVVAVELEIRVLASLPLAHGVRLASTADPKVTALRLVKSPREAGLVAIGDLAALGAAYLTFRRAPPAAPLSPLMQAARAYEAACEEAESFRFTSRERGALQQCERAFNSLLSILGVDNVETVES